MTEPAGPGAPAGSGGVAMALVGLALRLVLGGIFAWAAYLKISDPQQFTHAIKAFDTDLPDRLIIWSTFAVPWTEMLCAAALIVGVWTRAAATTVALMLVLFTGLVISAILRHLNLEHCGCFGRQGLLCHGPPGWCHVGENGLMLAMALVIALTGRQVVAADCLLERRARGRA